LSFPADTDPRFSKFSQAQTLVSSEWVDQHKGSKGLVVIECDEDILLYSTGHIPSAIKLDWHTELNDSVVRDYLNSEEMAMLLSSKGISREDTVVIYGDKSNWWATYAFWVLKLFGHEDVRIMDGGRAKWVAEGRELTKELPAVSVSQYPIVVRDESRIRAYKEDVLKHFGKPLIDVRSPQEYSGERTHMPDYPDEGALRGGHIPSAASVPWSRAVNEDQTFKSFEELNQIYRVEAGISDSEDVIAYCRIGERSSHTWFVLTYLLGIPKVRNYDGSWTEWGSAVRVPIVKGSEPGSVPEGF